jgi:hypothetical protein
VTNTRKIILGILSLLLLTNISVGAVELKLTPVNGINVVQGGSISYTATVTLTEAIGFPRKEEFSIKSTDVQPLWVYDFDPMNVTLEKKGESKTSTLTITVPITAPTGLYRHIVIATGYDDLGNEIIIEAEVDTFAINTAVAPVPESRTIILTSLGLVGMFIVTRKYKN